MKYVIILLLTALLFSCKKEKPEEPVTEIQVTVYATPANDTTIVASTQPISLRLQ